MNKLKSIILALTLAFLCGCYERGCEWKATTKRPIEIGQVLTAPQKRNLIEATESLEKFLIARTTAKSCMGLRATKYYWVTCDRKTGKIIAIWTRGD